MQKNKFYGFTLIELMITVVVIAVLASIAYPAYQDYVTRARRGDAKAGLLKLQQAQEKYRTNCTEYAHSILADDHDGTNDSVCDTVTPSYKVEHSQSSPDGNYTLIVESADATTYKLTATYTGIQTRDSNCKTLSVEQDGTKTSTDSDDNASSDCWEK